MEHSTTATTEFRAMNTDWWVFVPGCRDDATFSRVEQIVRDAEAAFSRFLPDSLLTRLNRERCVADPSLAELVRRAFALSKKTRGAFDPRVGAAVAAAGYDVSFEQLADRAPSDVLNLAAPVGALSVEVANDTVELRGVGALDLGGIAKGWAIDQIAAALHASGRHEYVIDGGGDIRTGGHSEDRQDWPIGVGPDFVAYLAGQSVATSSTVKRRWTTPRGEAHHVIDPDTGMPSASVVTNAVVIAHDATTADALATAIVANPAHGVQAVMAVDGGALIEQDGMWRMTPGMERWIR